MDYIVKKYSVLLMKSIYHVRKVVFLSRYCILYSYLQIGRSRGVKTGSSNKHGGTLVRFCPSDLSRTSILYY